MKYPKLFTSESVSEGHPDKIADQISDAILDAILEQDPMSRVACETTVTTGLVLVVGEITTEAYVDIQKTVRDTIKKIGYDRGKLGFDAENVAVIVAVDEQSPDISAGVNTSLEAREAVDDQETGAGDQGMMFGFATNETPQFMPLANQLANKLMLKLSELRKSKTLKYLRPDAKGQVTVEYDDDGKIKRIDTIVISTQHDEKITLKTLQKDIFEQVIQAVVPGDLLDENTKILINPSGRFVIGGPKGDAGLTGRKIIVDTYGGFARHGGGAFSGKDATKVDRSASYAARHIAKNVVASGIADKAEIQLSYAIGVAHPVSVSVDTFGTGKVSEDIIATAIMDNFDLTPDGIINNLDLRRPIYQQTATYGHFGRDDLDLPWERLDKINVFKQLKDEAK